MSAVRLGPVMSTMELVTSAGFQFATYATKRIQGAIIDELRREDFLPKRLRARVQIYQTTRDDLMSRLHRSPTIHEVASELGIEMEEAIRLHDEATVLTHLSPLVVGNEANEGRVLGAAVPAPTSGLPASTTRSRPRVPL